MKLKSLMICVVIVSLTGCFGNKNSENAQAKPVVQTQLAQKIDYKKAALLNVEMGEKYLAMGQVARAKRKFIHALELLPSLPEAHSSIGFFYESVGDIEEAEEHHKQAIKLASSSKGRFYNNYGIFLCHQKRFKEADVAFKKAIKDRLYIKTAEAYENAGQCALMQPDEEKARMYFELAVKRDPQRALASLELARMELARNNIAVAKKYLENYRSQVEPSPKSLLLGIQINKKLGHYNDVASAEMLLKGKYADSPEYKQYLELMNHG
jgi:type IV pilus assembly protein PilF